uniref:Ribosomal protein S19 n=1 Tax=Proschkinia sp. SZCZR1824 TaxID=2588390 RepID=A0A4Y5SFK7_9STRA|nr:ribosomal protein S19 [Proschkinia sp. SZCZR1824]
MGRAKWKGPFLNLKQNTYVKKTPVYFVSKDSNILPRFVGLQFMIYNGQKYINVSVHETMIGHKFGEFVITRAKFIFKKVSK